MSKGTYRVAYADLGSGVSLVIELKGEDAAKARALAKEGNYAELRDMVIGGPETNGRGRVISKVKADCFIDSF